MRRLLLAVVLFGALGLGAELVLLEHYEEVWQYTPFVTLGVAAVAVSWVGLRPGRRAVRVLQGTMILLVAAGLVGVWLHFGSNRAFELEMEAEAAGLALAWAALRGATPSLAPGALVQLGLLGLIATWKHPALEG